MVKLETRIQLAIKEILEEETWKHLKTNNNFDNVLSIASLIEPFDEGLMCVMKTVEVCVLVVTMAINTPYDWRASYNLRDKKPFRINNRSRT